MAVMLLLSYLIADCCQIELKVIERVRVKKTLVVCRHN